MSPATLRRCTRCVLPETHETITFDGEGVCNICRQQEFKREAIDWTQRKSDLDAIVEAYRGKGDYDCIVPFSGGKDSTFTALYLVREYGLKPLLVRFDHGFLRERLHENTLRVIRRLGVDLHVFTPNWKTTLKLMLQSFLEKGDFCWHCHTGIFAYPMWVALHHKTPLIFWGEPSSEYTAYFGYDQSEEVDEKRFNRFVNLGITAQDMFIRLQGNVDERDLKPYTYPPLRELRALGYRSVCLGSYIPWDVKRQTALIQEQLGWQGDQVEGVPPGYEYEKIECMFQGVRDYIKHIKRGYSRTSHLTSLDIRNGRLDREAAMGMVERHEGLRPRSLELFLEYMGITLEEFLDIAMRHSISPYRHDPARDVAGPPTHDFPAWPRGDGLDPEQARAQIGRWRETQGGGKG
ncbi:hypothetical protein NNJEOMEG_02707 [Fundidesulfovibrio magnetotacticus]|uniref:N-acetyl sugar amidotransferase n=1 Tax=Fundidesulfovibrio magnetotacticus TaxID=2730080 RepID=A0A6V8LXT0_9BACT|nr:N-acetyl sugar amidotransferase [Fundidesulfovibrio magnetotacticus]GFK94859.1 hypothetical protein NNJEOMEG_02707 [Fundidesulfovibrio magnetotacticus]